MKKNLLLIIILNSCLILGFSSNIFAKKAAIVIDFDTEEVLFEVNADTRNYPASLTKIMTCLLYTSPSPRDVEESRMPSCA